MFNTATTATMIIVNRIPPTMNTHLDIVPISRLRRIDMSGRKSCNRAAIAEGQDVFRRMHEYPSVTEKRADESFGTGQLNASSLQPHGAHRCKYRSTTYSE
jgi:hypothetical protein